MGKDKPGFMTPKAIANRIKAKGLQKLRWYCQMCQKQCRDENGFKCHVMSESHQRQLLLFADNSRRFLDEFSREFKLGFLLALRHRFGTKRVSANVVYQEYISDRNHIHMNATKWHTLTGFVQYLGREAICHVDQTEKGWFIQYIDRDPETLRRQEELAKKRKLDIDDREKQIIFIEKQIAKEKERKNEEDQKPVYTELQRSDDTIKITFKKPKLEDDRPTTSADANKNEDDEYEEKDDETEESGEEESDEEKKEPKSEESVAASEKESTSSDKAKNVSLTFKKPAQAFVKPTTSSAAASNVFKQAEKKMSAIDEIMLAKEKEREKQNRKDHWLHKNIIVKIITKKLGDKYLNKKGIVLAVKDVYVAIVKLIESDTILKVDQAHLETVLPAIGKKVLVVNGGYRGLEAVLESIDTEALTARIRIDSGPLKGRVVNDIQYEDICKLYEENK